MAAKINTTKKIGGMGSGCYKAEPDVMMGGAKNTGTTGMNSKKRGGASPATGNGYGTAKGLGGGARTGSTNRDNDTDAV